MRPWFTLVPFLHLIKWQPKECYHAARFEKESRYYVIRLSKDLLDDWVITLINGRIKSKLGQSRTLAFAQFSAGFEHFCNLAKIRNTRGYQLTSLTCDNHLLMHLLPFLHIAEEKKEESLFIKQTKPETNKTRKLKSPAGLILTPIATQQLGFGF